MVGKILKTHSHWQVLRKLASTFRKKKPGGTSISNGRKQVPMGGLWLFLEKSVAEAGKRGLPGLQSIQRIQGSGARPCSTLKTKLYAPLVLSF